MPLVIEKQCFQLFRLSPFTVLPMFLLLIHETLIVSIYLVVFLLTLTVVETSFSVEPLMFIGVMMVCAVFLAFIDVKIGFVSIAQLLLLSESGGYSSVV